MEYFGEGCLTVKIPENEVAPEMIFNLEDGEISSEALARLVGYLPKCKARVFEMSILGGRHIGFVPGLIMEDGEEDDSPEHKQRLKLMNRELKSWVRQNGGDFTTSPQTKH